MKKMVFGIALMAMLAFSAYAQQFCNEANFRWERVGNGVRITGHVGTSRDVRIPPQIQGMPVVEIGDGAFEGTWAEENGEWILINWLNSITIPNSVTIIGAGAFSWNKLTSVTIPLRVTVIQRGAFADNQLTSVTIPDSVTTIGAWAFADNQLTSVVIPNSVSTIYAGTFSGNQLTSVSIPDSVTAIGAWAFSDNQLTSVAIPSSTYLLDNAFDSRVNVVRGRDDSNILDFTGTWISTIEGVRLVMIVTRNVWALEIPAFGFLSTGILVTTDGIDGRFYEGSVHVGTAFFDASADTITVNLNANAGVAPNQIFVAVRLQFCNETNFR